MPITLKDALASPVVGTLTGGIGSVVSSLFSQSAQREENQKNRDFQREMWERTNEWNSPANQRKLLEEGNYNPYLYGNDYQGSGASVPASPSTSPLPGIQNPMIASNDIYSKKASLLQQQQQIESNVELQKMKALGEVADTMIKLYKDGGQAQVDEFLKSYAPYLNALNFEGSYYQQRIQKEFLSMDIANDRADIERSLLNLFGKDEYKKKLSLMDNEINVKKAEVNKLISEKNVNYKRIEELGSEMARNFAQAGFFGAQTSQITALLPYIRGIMEDDALRSTMDFETKLADYTEESQLRDYKKTPWNQLVKKAAYADEHNFVTDFVRGFASALPISSFSPSGTSIGTKYYGREGIESNDWRRYVYVNE